MQVIDLSKRGKEKIFLGEFSGYFRRDIVSHKVADNLVDLSRGNVWFPKEINFTKDTMDSMGETVKRALRLTNSYQNLADSGVTIGFSTIMPHIVSSSIWQLVYNRVAGEENTHSDSYGYGLLEAFGSIEASKILDAVYIDEHISSRLFKEVDAYSKVWDICILQNRKDDEAKKAILELLVRVYMLESVKFPMSFYVTLTINKFSNGAIQGMARNIRFIARDEMDFHVAVGMNVLNILRREEVQGFSHLFKSGWFEEMYSKYALSVYKTEIEWAEYLTLNGAFQGFNVGIAKEFLQYRIDFSTKNINLPPIFSQSAVITKPDSVIWFDMDRDINLQNVAGQEAENSSYQKGGLVNDLGDEIWE